MKEVRADIRCKLLSGLAACRERSKKQGRELTKGYCYFTAGVINSIEVDECRHALRCITQSRKTGELTAETFLPWDLLERMDESI